MSTRGPEPIGKIVAELMSQKGFARVQGSAELEEAWQAAAGAAIARFTRVGLLRRGRLEVVVANSVLIQELGFQKPAILEALKEKLPDRSIKDLRFKVGPVESF
jgi:predicted nucleic acid-binding Zn ribbon protein